VNARSGLLESERRELPDSAFAYIDSAGRRRLPIHDEAHVRNALARFNRVVFDDDAARDRARTRLLRAARCYGIVPVGFIEGQIRPRLPTGQLALLLADIEASSSHLADLGERHGLVLNAVRRMERAAIRTAARCATKSTGGSATMKSEHQGPPESAAC